MTNVCRQKVICILGMHRSGTSCMMGTLQKSGLYLGKHTTWNAHNERGNRENDDIRQMNEELLEYNNASWKKPILNIKFTKDHIKKGNDIIGSFSEHKMWGFKDPRTLLVLDFWKYLLKNLIFIGIYRHPFAVALSLGARGSGIGMDVDKAYDLWNDYNKCLLNEYCKSTFPVFSFDWDEEYFHEKINKLNTKLGLNQIKENERFFTPSLRHHSEIKHTIIPDHTLEIYNQLQSIAY